MIVKVIAYSHMQDPPASVPLSSPPLSPALPLSPSTSLFRLVSLSLIPQFPPSHWNSSLVR